MKYIDLHTHRQKEKESFHILNIFAQDFEKPQPPWYFSVGLHPWHILKVNPDECFRTIEYASELKNMLAIGECGLDRSIKTDFVTQEKFFKNQIEIAERFSKPLIIHCVRAYSDLIKLKKETKSKVSWIIHAYNGNQQTTQSLINHGFYFSLGEQFLKLSSKFELIKTIPANRLFLETDDRDIAIEEVYHLAAQVLKIDKESLRTTIFSNFRNIFGNVDLNT
jgi:TatD DNase family protein